jgi:hypothetical protein
MSNKRSPSQTLKVLLLCSFSVLLLFFGFFTNTWRVADQHWFDTHQRDMESFIMGRMVESRQHGIFSSGGLTGQGDLSATQPGYSDDYNYNQYLAYTNGFPFEAYTSYNSQIGGQGIFFSILDKLSGLSSPEKMTLFHAFTSLLSAMALAAIILWFYLEFGLTVALFVLASAVFSQWLVVFGRNLWWSLWSFYLPVVVIMYYLRFKRNPMNVMPFTSVIVFAVFLKCLFTGYEYITTTLIMMVVPLVYYGILQRWDLRRFFTGLVKAIFGSCLAILLTFIILCFQVAAVKGSFRDGIHHIVFSFEKRTYANPQDFPPEYTASLKSGTVRVVARYLWGTYFDANNYLSCSNRFVSAYLLKVRYFYVVLLFMMASAMLYLLRERVPTEEERRKHLALVFATWFSMLAPLSWFIIFKSHSYLHVHMNFIVWQMPFIFFGFAVCGLAVKALLPARISRQKN